MHSGTRLLALLMLSCFLYTVPAHAFVFGDVVEKARAWQKAIINHPRRRPDSSRI